MEFIYLLADANVEKICSTLTPIMTIVGYLVYAIKIIVPVLLLVMGMFELATAITEKKDDKIKEATSRLIRKVVAAVCVYLVPTIVGMIINLIDPNVGWKDCAKCVFTPTPANGCYIIHPEYKTEN